MGLTDQTALELSKQLRARNVSAREVADAFLDRISTVDSAVKAFLHLNPEDVRTQADAAQIRLDAGEGGPLTGIPIAIKDVICTKGLPTTCGSKILEGYRPPYDATSVGRLKALGAVILGKTNCDEFAMGSSTEMSGYFPTHNPWSLDRVPGGSSGGSAAAVASGEAPLALGTDTGGSIRQPASFCGVVGVKPTYGRVSRYGLVAFSSSLDQIGPFAHTVEDAALALTAISGVDRMDATSVDVPVQDYAQQFTDDIKGKRIGYPKEFMNSGVSPAVREAVHKAFSVLADAGATVEETSLPSTVYGVGVYYIIAPSEASSNLARYDGVRYGYRTPNDRGHVHLVEQTREEGFGEEVKRRIILGTYALSAGYYDAYYLKAQKVRTKLRHEFDQLFERYDLIVGPTSPTVAFRIGEFASDPLALKMADILTIPANLAGLCAVSLQCGLSEGLPIGLQIIGKPFSEVDVLNAAHVYEQRTEWHKTGPPLEP